MCRAVKAFRRQLVDSWAAFGSVFRNPNLRRLQLAGAGSTIGQWAYAVAVSVYAYNAGGAKAVGLVWVIRMGPAALVSPFSAVLADRYDRARVMITADLVRAGLIGAAAATAYLHGSPWVVYILAGAIAVIGTPFKPAESALVPALASTPSELTAANVVASTIESLGFFFGPALAGLLLGFASAPTVFVVTGAFLVWSAYFVARIKVVHEPAPESAAPTASVLSDVAAGFGTLIKDRRLRILVGLLGAQTIVAGALEVLVVVTAISLLRLGNSGVGYLNSFFGIGAFVGAVVGGVALVGLRRLSVPFLVGSLLWGLPFILIGAFVNKGLAFVALAVMGAGGTLVDVSGFTLVQRAVPDEILGRVFGIMQMLWLGAVAVGAIVTPPLISGIGSRGALIAMGCFVPALLALFGLRLFRIDAEATAPGAELIDLLRGIDMFSLLPGIAIEQLAFQLIPLEEPAGTVIIREGDPGDRFYIIQEGQVDVSTGGKHLAVLGRGSYVGEIALLRDVPRTATCVASTPVKLLALERNDFLNAVTGHAGSMRTADAVVGARLAEQNPVMTPADV